MAIKKSVVSVIVPVYNAASTLHRCLDSLRNQTYAHLELLFVNDCSTDDSLAVLINFESLWKDQGTVRIISHIQNQGVAAARNTGLDHATGQYIYYVDADDWIDRHAICAMVELAEAEDAAIVGFNWYLSFPNRERLMRQTPFSTPEEALRLLMVGRMRWNLWIFLSKRSLYEDHHIRFIPQLNMGEDMMVMFKLFAVAKKVCFLEEALYHYGQTNEESISKIYSDRHMEEVTQNVAEAARFVGVHMPMLINDELLHLLKLTIKLPLLISDSRARYAAWRAWFGESNGYAWDNSNQGFRIRLLQWAALKKQYWILWLHYHLVIRLVYGVIYK